MTGGIMAEMYLTGRTTLTVEMEADSAWDTKCQADQVFTAVDRENRNRLENILREHKIRVISSETTVVMAKKIKS